MAEHSSMEGLPLQPVVVDKDGIIRFQANKIVRDFFGAASAGQKLDLNAIAARLAKNPKAYTRAEQMQFAMLTGYSVSGAGDLSYFDPVIIEEAQKAGEEVAKRVALVKDAHALPDEKEPKSLTAAMAEIDKDKKAT